ncbi:hypothetical protein BHK98_01735 [Hornefia porci]|uniref:Uncharacterized protein n=1 Tax=Hornefia porci TaxID=2652292 RepID=A0A1Q9JFF2_9FIRM|nr:hypothetical protein [Hornefia porci]OLR54913.1 hypothetical protein BHK98_01735 [Hornefia porci]
MTFNQVFLRIYDRKISSGEITFSQSGISKNDFTQLCTDPEFVFSEEALALICERMAVDREERELLYELAGYGG